MNPSTDNLTEYLQFLAMKGIAAQADLWAVKGKSSQTDIVIDDVFYPLWELNDPRNAEALARLDFKAIKDSRKPDWSPFEGENQKPAPEQAK